MLPDRDDIEQASKLVYASLQPTAQITWPLLNARAGAEIWVKHENHNPTGAFKVRGGLVYLQRLIEREPSCTGVCTATRGNHGQSVGFAAARLGLGATVVVPEGNSPDKNAAMKALGVNLVIAGQDFDESILVARDLAARDNLHMMPSYHRDLVAGVASYGIELFSAVAEIDRIYVPIGLGSGISGILAARAALAESTGATTEVVGVVSENANTYALSLAAGKVVGTNSADTIADGLAVRNANADALAVMAEGVSRIVTVSDDEVRQAMRHYFSDTHNIAEGAGAAGLAAILSEKARNRGARVATVLTGGNVSAELYREVLKP